VRVGVRTGSDRDDAQGDRHHVFKFERVRATPAEAEEMLNHRVIGLEQYLEALAEQDVSAVVGGRGTAVPEAPTEKMAPVVEFRRTVARRENGMSVEVLGADYRGSWPFLRRGGER
jgi:hypothetical protein